MTRKKDPELRNTVLTLVAFHDLEEKIRACGGDREKGIQAFLNQNDSEGWMLPKRYALQIMDLAMTSGQSIPKPVCQPTRSPFL